MPLVLTGSGSISNGSTGAISIDSSGRVINSSQPSFHAYNSSAPSVNWANGSYIIYNATEHNVGSGYNTSNGRFTAPIAGRYFFGWSHIGTNSNSCYRYTLYKNGNTAVAGSTSPTQARLDGSGSKYPFGTRAAIFNLVAGDYMQIYYTSDDGAAAGNWDYYTFYGYLIA